MTMHLTRVQLRRDASISALIPVLMPDRAENAVSHHLVWSLMSDGPARRRDFLYRETDGTFYVLSDREPHNPHSLFDLATRTFSPKLRPHDRLGFTLRANPVVRRKRSDGKTTKHDVVMDALRAVPAGQQPCEARMRVASETTKAWLGRMGETGGYRLGEFVLDGYRQIRIPRRGAAPVQIGVVDVTGTLTVADPDVFVARVREGFGASRGWGYGLMLIRRL
jgi:CRISPR system Cascade subunit CasE